MAQKSQYLKISNVMNETKKDQTYIENGGAAIFEGIMWPTIESGAGWGTGNAY